MKMNKTNQKVQQQIFNAIQFIEENCTSKLLLEDVAQKAFLSPYHFHRLFKSITNETFTQFVIRKRIEKAADLLLHASEKTVSEISDSLGFNSISSFSRAFKKFYGITPTAFKNKSQSKFSKICKTESKNGKTQIELNQYVYNMKEHVQYIEENTLEINVKQCNEISVAYVPHIGPFEENGKAFEQLLKWAYPKGLMNDEPKIISLYHNSPKLTEVSKLKMSACISIENKNIDTSDINTRIISKGKYVNATFVLGLNEFKKTYEALFVWISEKGFIVNNELDPYEIYHNDFNTHPERKCHLTIFIPVK